MLLKKNQGLYCPKNSRARQTTIFGQISFIQQLRVYFRMNHNVSSTQFIFSEKHVQYCMGGLVLLQVVVEHIIFKILLIECLHYKTKTTVLVYYYYRYTGKQLKLLNNKCVDKFLKQRLLYISF